MVAGVDADDAELAAFLRERVDDAVANPSSGPSRGRLAMAYDANGFDEAAVAGYSHAAALQPDEFLWPYLRALLLAHQGDYERALADLGRALALDGDYAPAWLWRGNWLMDLGRVGEAADAFRRALELAPDESTRVAADAGLARALLAQGDAEDAHRLLSRLAESAPHPVVLRLLASAGRALGRESDLPPSVEIEAVALEWADPLRARLDDFVRGFDARLRQAEGVLSRGDAEAALDILEPLRKQRPGDRTLLNNLAIAYAATGKPATAMETLQEGLRLHDDYYLFHFNAAVAYEERGDTRTALMHLDRALSLQPAFSPAHERKVLVLIGQQRHDDALAAVATALAEGVQTASMMYRAGVVEGSRGRWGNAIRHFHQAVSLAPRLARAHLALARSLAEAGRHDEARGALDDAERLGAASADIASARRRIEALSTSESS
ncbi:MAG: tetratricopeptide repeat protein [Gammaproteobacteria bacterium]|nr:tetratricopeptide repeat protein [Gammaproteobacteria bacterium]